MKERKLDIGVSQFRTLHLIGEDGLYTNLALLLSDQCEHTLKLAVFQGTDKAVFRDRKEFSGSVLKQLDEMYEAIDRYNKTQSTIKGLYRIDKRDYDEEPCEKHFSTALCIGITLLVQAHLSISMMTALNLCLSADL